MAAMTSWKHLAWPTPYPKLISLSFPVTMRSSMLLLKIPHFFHHSSGLYIVCSVYNVNCFCFCISIPSPSSSPRHEYLYCHCFLSVNVFLSRIGCTTTLRRLEHTHSRKPQISQNKYSTVSSKYSTTFLNDRKNKDST